MDYSETLHYLYTSMPVFQHTGASAYKPGLQTSIALDNYLGNPHRSYKTIHVAGTNGKGSTSHLLAAVLQEAGYNVGLYTSPHLVDFRERIRTNGKMIPQEYVVDFVRRHHAFVETLHPSFFELTMSMAFDYFRFCKVDVAVIEVGLGGRLDSTNIITPLLGIITNISLDHTQFLGDTLEKIASEKAGIIKTGIPVIIGNATGTVREIFDSKAREMNAPILYAAQQNTLADIPVKHGSYWEYESTDFGKLKGELTGIVQVENTQTVLTAIRQLKTMGFAISAEAVRKAFCRVVQLTGLRGRWQLIHTAPRMVCDTGHNVGGIEPIVRQLAEEKYDTLHMIIGMVNDKDVNGVLSLLPKNATYYFTKASIERALPEATLGALAQKHQLKGRLYSTVGEAICAARENATENDFIFIGGSTFVVADALKILIQ